MGKSFMVCFFTRSLSCSFAWKLIHLDRASEKVRFILIMKFMCITNILSISIQCFNFSFYFEVSQDASTSH